MDWSPDGSALAIYKATAETGRDLYILPLGGDAEPEEFLSTPFEDRGVSFSPNGQWLVYVSAEAGQDEIYVRPYPGPGGEVIVSTGGGQEAVWGPGGTELFYRNGDEVMVVNVQTEGAFSATAPKLLFDGNFALDNAVGGGGNPNYDIAPDGESFVMVVADDPGQGANPIDVPITVVINWFEELTDRVPVD
jgi:serine/threonine-protein kinase